AWPKVDTTITTDDAQGVNSWFIPRNDNWYTYTDWAGASWGAMAPGFRGPQTLPGCGATCWEILRRDGDALRERLSAVTKAQFSLLEGWTDIFESAGYYRSVAWSSPNRSIGVVREYADPTPETIRFQTEAADNTSTRAQDLNPSREYRIDVPNIGKLADA